MKEERKEGCGGIGHTFGVRVDGPLARGLWPPDGGRLCRGVVKEKVLRIDRPNGRRVLKFDGLSGRGLWWRPSVHSEHILHYANWICKGASAT